MRGNGYSFYVREVVGRGGGCGDLESIGFGWRG